MAMKPKAPTDTNAEVAARIRMALFARVAVETIQRRTEFMSEGKKPVIIVQVCIYEDGRMHVNTEGITDQVKIREILHSAEEAVIQSALRKVTESQSKIIPATGIPLSKIH